MIKHIPLASNKHPRGVCKFRLPVSQTLANIYHYPVPFAAPSFPGNRRTLTPHPALISLMTAPYLGARHTRARIYNRMDHMHRYNSLALVRRRALTKCDCFNTHLARKNKVTTGEALFCLQNKTQSVYSLAEVGEGAPC